MIARRRGRSPLSGTSRATSRVKEDVNGNQSDLSLVRAARRGSRAAQAELARRHWRLAWKRAFAITGRAAAADDVAQESVVSALVKLDELADPGAFGPWLARIATRRALDVLRAERRFVDLDSLPEPSADWASGLGEAADTRRAVAALSPERRAVIVMRYWLDLMPSEIGEALELPVGTVNSRIARALGDLRLVLEEQSHA